MYGTYLPGGCGIHPCAMIFLPGKIFKAQAKLINSIVDIGSKATTANDSYCKLVDSFLLCTFFDQVRYVIYVPVITG